MMGIFVLLLACANYINIGVVTASRRLREIGIRKVVGGSRAKLVVQFLGEHTLTCLAALLLGAVFTDIVIFPFFNGLFPAELELDFFNNPRLWVFYTITLVVTVLGSGAYPALYVSRFKPVEIMSKTPKVGGSSKTLNVLLAFQFILTFLLIGTSFIFVQNAEYQMNLDWGYEPDRVINVYLKGAGRYDVYRNAIAQHPDIVSLGGARHNIGSTWSSTSVDHQGEEYAVAALAVRVEYLETMRVRLKQGRLFDRESSGDQKEIIVNEKFVRTMGWAQPLARKVVVNKEEFTVIGVVADFYNQPFREPVKPVLFRLCSPRECRYLSIRVRPGKEEQTAGYLENSWKRLFPLEVYEGFYQDQIWDWQYRENEGVYRLSGFLSLMALVISCMGLFGLISVSVARRLKKISIRKVLGASMMNIVELVNKTIFKILVIVPLIAIPLCYVLMDWYLEFCYHGSQTPLTAGPFLYAALMTLSSQILKAARMNIVDTLREE